MSTRNVTLALPEDLVKRAKVLAAERDTSVSALVGDLLAQLVDTGSSYEQMWQQEEAVMAQGPLRVGERAPMRDEAHRR